MSVDQFFETLRDEQDRSRSRADYVERARARLASAASATESRKRKARPAALTLGVAGALALAAAIALFVTHAGEPGDALAFSVGEKATSGTVGAFIAAPKAHDLPIRFADGTSVALSPGAGARVLSVTKQGAHMVLERGRAVASVVHGPESRWRVDAGPFEVAVVGTRFELSWDPGEQALLLVLNEGAVVVSGSFLKQPMRVGAGQTLRAHCSEGRAELSDRSLSGSPKAEVVLPPVVPPPGPGPEARAAPSAREAQALVASWQTLAASGKFREALVLVEQAGFEAECRRASGRDLLTLGDTARLAGSAARAREAYLAARGKLPGGGRATYGLGLTAFDQQGDFATAARWFETYLSEQPSGTLRAEASGRLLESLSRSGQTARARQVSEQYLSRYPKGAHAALARQILAP